MLVIRSIGVSGRATSPTAPMVSSAMTRSGRSGGRTRSALSFMLDLRRERGLYLVGEQQLVDAPLQRIESGRAHVAKADVAGIELGLHAAWMRGEHEDAVADQQRFLDRVGDEDHREADVLPQRHQFLLHLAAGER